MSTTSKNLSIEQQHDNPDLESLLQTIESLYSVCRTVFNIHTQTTIMLSITIEAQMMLMKLRIMKERWRFHLPFKEACTVDFFDWGRKINNIVKDILSCINKGETFSEYCPSKHYVLDLHEMLPEIVSAPEHSPYYKELDVQNLICLQDKIRQQLNKQWETYMTRLSDVVSFKVDESIGDVLPPLREKGYPIRMACCEVLHQLAEELYQLDEMPSGVIQSELFDRLARRVVCESDYNGLKAQKAARRYVDNLKNVTPKTEWEKRCKIEYRLAVHSIYNMKYGRKVFKYLAKNYNIEEQYAGFGQFLHSFRADISREELYGLMEQLYRILYFHDAIEAQKTVEEICVQTVAPDTATISSPKDAKSVYIYRRSIPTVRPPLPRFFSGSLTSNHEATTAFYDVLHHIGFYIGRPLLAEEKNKLQTGNFEGWKWSHLFEALKKTGVIRKDTPKKWYADYIAKTLPYVKADNVRRSLNSRGAYGEDVSTFNNIVNSIVDEFKIVSRLLLKSTKR